MKVSNLILAALLFGAATTAWADPGDKISVEARSAALAEKPMMWAKAVEMLKYGDVTTEISFKDGWFKVRSASGREGFLHESAVTDRRIVLQSDPDAARVVPDRSKVVMAGKGFSKEIEEQHRREPDAGNYAAVDSIERRKPVSGPEIEKFILQGKLNI